MIEIGEMLRERNFIVLASEKVIDKIGDTTFIREHALPDLCQQADTYFGKDNWKRTNFDSYWEDKSYCVAITCCEKIPEKNIKIDK